MLLHETDDISAFSARPAPVALSARIDVKRRIMIVVEGTQALEGGTRLAQRKVAPHDIDDVVGFLHLPDQVYPIVRQRAPVAGMERIKGIPSLPLIHSLSSVVADRAAGRFFTGGGGSSETRFLQKAGFSRERSLFAVPLGWGRHSRTHSCSPAPPRYISGNTCNGCSARHAHPSLDYICVVKISQAGQTPEDSLPLGFIA